MEAAGTQAHDSIVPRAPAVATFGLLLLLPVQASLTAASLAQKAYPAPPKAVFYLVLWSLVPTVVGWCLANLVLYTRMLRKRPWLHGSALVLSAYGVSFL